MAGLEQLIDYIKGLKFTKDDMNMLRKRYSAKIFLNLSTSLSSLVMFERIQRNTDFPE